MAKIFDKTKGDDTANTGNIPDFNKTQVLQNWGDGTEIDPALSQGNQSPRDFSKTFIQEETHDSSGESVIMERSTRKITGWLVSFTIDPMGVDFRIYEGNNSVGRDHDNSIVIAGDMAVSGKHFTILAKRTSCTLKMKWRLMALF